jgi:hypothetical protein
MASLKLFVRLPVSTSAAEAAVDFAIETAQLKPGPFKNEYLNQRALKSEFFCNLLKRASIRISALMARLKRALIRDLFYEGSFRCDFGVVSASGRSFMC